MRSRSCVVRIRVGRTCVRAIVHVTASSLNPQTNHPREMQPAFLLERRCKFNTLTPTSPEFPKNFARLTAGLKKTPPPFSATFFARYEKISKNDVCFRRASPRVRFFRLTRFAGLPRKNRGATSSTHAQPKPRSTHTSRTHPRTCHGSRNRQQPEPANQSV